MQNKHTIYIFLLFIFLLIFNIEGLSQKLITYKAENQSLNTVLSKISSVSKVRFAFDDDCFSKINVTFNVNKLPVEEFLKQLSSKFPVTYKLIGQTWVVYKDEKKVVARPRPKVEAVKPVPPPVIKKKIVYKKERLWDLNGTVIDVKSGNRLKSCRLFVDEYTMPITNDLGLFTDEVVSTGDVRMKIVQSGFYTLDTTLVLSDGKEIVLKLNPIAKIENLSDKSYSGIFHIDMPENTYFVELNPRSANYISGTGSTDFANSTKLFSGINFSEGNDAGFRIRGASTSENLILLDGIPALNSSHLFGQISTLNSKFIHQAFISRGGFGAEYGGSSSGIIELTGKSGLSSRPFVDFTANLLDANLFVGIPISKKISVSGAIRKSIVDYWPNYFYQKLAVSSLNLQTLGTEVKNGMVTYPFNSYYDINFKVTIQPTSWNEFNFILSNGYDNQKRGFGVVTDKNYFIDFKSDRRNLGFGLNWKFRSKNLWYNTLVASYNTLEQNNGLESGFKPGESGLIQSENDFNNSSEVLLKWKSEFKLKKFSNQFGAEFNLYHLNYNYHFYNDISTGIEQIASDSISSINNKLFANLFYQGKYKLNKWFDLSAGIRGLIDFSSPKLLIQPRASIEFKPNDLCKIYYRFGHYIQPFYQTRRFGSDLNPVTVGMLPTSTDQYIKSIHHIAGGNLSHKGLSVNVEGYLMNSKGKATYFADRNNVDISTGEIFKIYSGSSILKGVDATIQLHHNFFSHSLAYSFSDSKEKYSEINNDNFYPLFNNPRHHLKFSETMAYSGWIVSASFNYYSGSSYLLQNSTIDQFNLSQLPYFSQLDFSLVRQISLKSLKIEAGAVLLNVLGSKKVKNIEFFQLGEKSNYILKSASNVIPFSPTFFITIKFD